MKPLYLKEQLSARYFATDFNVSFTLKQERKGKNLQLKEKHLNHLIFLLEGEMNVSYGDFRNHFCKGGEMIFIARDSNAVGETYSDAEYLILSFNNQMSLFDQEELDSLREFYNEREIFNKLDIREPLLTVLESIIFYQKQGITNPELMEAKEKEIFLILKTFYSGQEIARFLKPILNQGTDFKAFIIKNYVNAKNVEELAEICDLSVRSLTRKFKIYFNDSPYRWMLKQKSHQIKILLADKKVPLQQIIREYGFSSPAHFTTYCKKHFGVTPSSYRKELTGKS